MELVKSSKITNKLGLDSLIDGFSQSIGESTINPNDLRGRGKSNLEQSNNTARVVRPPTTRLDTAIALYNTNLECQLHHKLSDTEVGSGARSMKLQSAINEGRVLWCPLSDQ